MPTITAIKPQKRPGHFNIFVDGKYSFSLDGLSLVQHHLAVDQEIDEDSLTQIKTVSAFRAILEKTINLIGLRPRSRAEINRYLDKNKLDSDSQAKVIDYLEKANLLNDRDFAQWWLSQRQTFRPKSLLLIKQELRAKGLTNEDLQSLKVSSDEEVQAAQGLLARKWPLWQKQGILKAKQKAAGFLSRRGYSWETAKTAIDRVTRQGIK